MSLLYGYDQRLASRGNRESSLLKHPIGLLAPGRTISDFLNVSHEFHEHNPLTLSGRIAYRDACDVLYDEPFTLDLHYYREILELAHKDTATEIEKLRKEITF